MCIYQERSLWNVFWFLNVRLCFLFVFNAFESRFHDKHLFNTEKQLYFSVLKPCLFISQCLPIDLVLWNWLVCTSLKVLLSFSFVLPKSSHFKEYVLRCDKSFSFIIFNLCIFFNTAELNFIILMAFSLNFSIF